MGNQSIKGKYQAQTRKPPHVLQKPKTEGKKKQPYLNNTEYKATVDERNSREIPK